MKRDNSIPFSRSDLVGHLAAFFPEGGERESFLDPALYSRGKFPEASVKKTFFQKKAL